MQVALRSVGQKIVNGSVSRRLFIFFVKAHLCFFQKRMQLGILSRNAAVFVTGVGDMCIFPAHGVCGSNFLCKKPCARSAKKIVNGSVYRRPCVCFVNAHLCFFHKRMQLGILSRNAAVL